MGKLRKIFFLLTAMLMMASVKAQSYYGNNGYGEFQADATLNNYTGKSQQLEGEVNLDSKMVHFRLPVQSLNTGNDKRNRDMYELLETDKYPYVEFLGEITSIDPTSMQPQKVTVSGIFKLHGVQRPLTVEGMLDRNEETLHIEAGWEMLITDYNIEPPKFLLNRVDDRHVIRVSADLEQEGKEKLP